MLGTFSFFIIVIFLTLTVMVVNITSSLHLITISELFWISYYGIVLILSYYLDDLNLLSLSLFFLVFSSVEISVALILIIFQTSVNNQPTFRDSNQQLLLVSNRFRSSKLI